jgi:hypothetical protein
MTQALIELQNLNVYLLIVEGIIQLEVRADLKVKLLMRENYRKLEDPIEEDHPEEYLITAAGVLEGGSQDEVHATNS